MPVTDPDRPCWRRRARRSAWAMSIIIATAWLVRGDDGGGAAPPPQHRPGLQWQSEADLPVGVFHAGISLSNDRIIVTGGVDQAGATQSALQVFDLATRQWTLMAPQLTDARCHHAQLTLPDGRILVAGGQQGHVPRSLVGLASTELIDPKTLRVTPGPQLPRVIKTATGHVLPDGRAVIVGGGSASVFDPATNQWQRHIVFRESRLEHASVLLDDGRIVVVGGTNRASIEALDLDRGISRMMSARLPESLDDLSVVALPGSRAWVLGGQSSQTGRTTDRTWIVDLSDPKRSRIMEGPRLGVPGGVADASVLTVGHEVVVLSGESDMGLRDRELTESRWLDTRTLAVGSLPDLPAPHDDAQAVAVGRDIWLVGGYRVSRPIPALEAIGVPTAVRSVQRLTLPAD